MSHLGSTEIAEPASVLHPGKGYNASVSAVREVHGQLRIVRVQLDERPPSFEPGQYVLLGLSSDEPVCDGAWPPRPTSEPALICRAYSLSARMIDDAGQLLHPRDDSCWEFYIALVPGTAEHPAALTPRLFALGPGRRLYVGRHPKGNYTLRQVAPEDDVIFAATGTGEAPHNAMIVALLSRGHRGRIVSVVGARYRGDLAYQAAHRRLEQLFPGQYRYLTLTTREPENVDPAHANYVGKQYVQQFFARGELERALGWELRPAGTHIFVCGNPQMVGAPNHHPLGRATNTTAYVAPNGLCELLESRGWSCDRPQQVGNVHYEQYGE